MWLCNSCITLICGIHRSRTMLAYSYVIFIIIQKGAPRFELGTLRSAVGSSTTELYPLDTRNHEIKTNNMNSLYISGTKLFP